MLYFPQTGTGAQDAVQFDPCHYVRLADMALLYGSREEAEALVTMAYVAFDLILAEGDDVTRWGRVWPGRNS
jgi:hypothetical protein